MRLANKVKCVCSSSVRGLCAFKNRTGHRHIQTGEAIKVQEGMDICYTNNKNPENDIGIQVSILRLEK